MTGAPEGVSLDAAGPDAAPTLAEVHATAFDRPWDAAAFCDLFAGAGVTALTATCHGQMVGFVLTRVVVDEAEVLTLAVRPEVRRTGVATALVHAAVTAAQAVGTAVLWLEVAQDNAAALALYRRCGFEQAGRRRGYYAGVCAKDALVMRRTLNTAPA